MNIIAALLIAISLTAQHNNPPSNDQPTVACTTDMDCMIKNPHIEPY